MPEDSGQVDTSLRCPHDRIYRGREMFWEWLTLPKDESLPFVEYDHVRSKIGSYLISGSNYIDAATRGDVVLSALDYQVRDFDKLRCAPNSLLSPLVDQSIVAVGGELFDSHQTVATIIKLRDGLIARYAYLRPLTEISCLDVERSIFDWLDPGKRIFHSQKLVYVERNMGERNFFRESLTGKVIISQRLKDLLNASGDGGLDFEGLELS